MKRIVEPGSATGADREFSKTVIRWQKQHGRHSLPWQRTRDAYRIWLSEIMLQQTQVATVIPYYARFLERFPDVGALAAAPVEDVMALWSGLGYYTRARNLHRCAQQVVAEHGGRFPADVDALASLPGIGRSTAAAISAFAYGTRAAILDGNVKRVFCRVFGVEGFPGSVPVERHLWERAVALLPDSEIERYTQGLMDLGATLCTRSRPRCADCPLQSRCVAHASDRIAELPARKPKKAVPEKSTVMLVIEHRDRVLLEQRPPSGIWGGLLSLPELNRLLPSVPARLGRKALGTALTLALAEFGEIDSFEALTEFVHAFTHYRLKVTPLRVSLSRSAPQAASSPYQWRSKKTLASAGLPAPVRKLLDGV